MEVSARLWMTLAIEDNFAGVADCTFGTLEGSRNVAGRDVRITFAAQSDGNLARPGGFAGLGASPQE